MGGYNGRNLSLRFWTTSVKMCQLHLLYCSCPWPYNMWALSLSAFHRADQACSLLYIVLHFALENWHKFYILCPEIHHREPKISFTLQYALKSDSCVRLTDSVPLQSSSTRSAAGGTSEEDPLRVEPATPAD